MDTIVRLDWFVVDDNAISRHRSIINRVKLRKSKSRGKILSPWWQLYEIPQTPMNYFYNYLQDICTQKKKKKKIAW